jgi:hypothetical protein
MRLFGGGQRALRRAEQSLGQLFLYWNDYVFEAIIKGNWVRPLQVHLMLKIVSILPFINYTRHFLKSLFL